MLENIVQALGGLGIFLLGMHIMTEGLRHFAGDSLRQMISRFTETSFSGVLTGAFTTALVQSSSVTTVTAVGFVAAGLMRFSQGLAIIVGANLGTTVTGWLVATLGFKLNFLILVQPLIFIGAVALLFFKGRLSSAGQALAGFGLIFVGIATMQLGMSGLTDIIKPESFPASGLSARFILVAIGLGITLITQSSSAGVAMAVTAVNAGTINLHQAAALVIGMDIGTTCTAYLATLGSTVAAKRTGYGHIFFNLMVGSIAFIILSPFFSTLEQALPGFTASDPEIALVSFHTFMNACGVMIALPLMGHFAGFLERLVPDADVPLTQSLEPKLIRQPPLAIEAIHRSLQEIAVTAFDILEKQLHGEVLGKLTCADLNNALQETRAYLATIPTDDKPEIKARKVSAVHLIDHLERLGRRIDEDDTIYLIRKDETFKEHSEKLHDMAVLSKEAFARNEVDGLEKSLESAWHDIDDANKAYRESILQQCVDQQLSTETAMAHLDAMRWIRRAYYHLWRIAHHIKYFSGDLPETSGDKVDV